MATDSTSEIWTVGRLIQWSTGHLSQYEVGAPRLSAELMLAQVLGCQRVDLYLRYDRPLDQAELQDFKALLLRRRQHEPVAYLVGRREFYSLELEVGPGVLVPRPETELLVEEGVKHLEGVEQPQVLDLCTGSGAVALALAAQLPPARVTGVDISPQCLGYARRNARSLGLDHRVTWLEGSLFDPLAVGGGFVDLITANPPYVTQDEYRDLPREVRAYEPAQALLGGAGRSGHYPPDNQGVGGLPAPLMLAVGGIGGGAGPSIPGVGPLERPFRPSGNRGRSGRGGASAGLSKE